MSTMTASISSRFSDAFLKRLGIVYARVLAYYLHIPQIRVLKILFYISITANQYRFNRFYVEYSSPKYFPCINKNK